MSRAPDPSASPRAMQNPKWLLNARVRAMSSTSGLVEQSILLLFTAVRGFMVIQLLISTSAQLQYRPETDVAIAWAGLAMGFSIAWIAVANITGRLDAWPWGVLDVAIGVGALIACELTLPPSWAIGTWLNWSIAYIGRVAVFVAAWHRSTRVPLVTGMSIAVIYLALVWPNNHDQWVAVLENFVDFPIFVLTATIFFTTIRRVARRADEHRNRAIELGAEVELLRYRSQVHDATGLLAALARPDTPADVLPGLQHQAALQSNRLRNSILQPLRPSHEGTDRHLDTVIVDAASGFIHLPLRLTVSLVRDVSLSAAQADAVKSALIALLFNVAYHARAQNVTIFADHDDEHWEISVCDDGIGFSPERVDFGFGLRTQVVAALELHGILTTIDSAPEAGTSITIIGPLAP